MTDFKRIISNKARRFVSVSTDKYIYGANMTKIKILLEYKKYYVQ